MQQIEAAVVSKPCAFCQKPVRGRSDKRFCNDQCRNSLNSLKNAPANATIRSITNVLKKNRRVLEQLSGSGNTAPIPKREMVNRGFQLEYCTQYIPQASGNPVICCFDFAYQVTANGKCRIINPKKQVK